MIFNTWAFATFCVLALAGYWTFVTPKRRRPYLIVIGAIFYAYAVPAYLLLVVSLGVVTYVLGNAMLRVDRARRIPYLIAGVTTIVGVLAFFKYAHFFESIVDAVARHHVLPVPSVLVPLAISFFTFEFVHVLVDVYEGKIERLGAMDFAVFAMFFPTLVAGPIKRYERFVPQLATLRPPHANAVAHDAYRIFLGLAKKTIVADSMTAFTAPIATPGDPFGRVDYVVAVLAYALKIYFDFSGYSDIAIGIGGLLGIRIPENFDRPYGAANIAEFWRRWHMSLSSWIRDYVYVPLGGNRGSRLRTALNLLLAMAIAGLWHGAAWTFVLWGLWHGFGLAIHRGWSAAVVPRVAFLRAPSRSMRALSIATTFSFVATGWILFAAPSLENARLVFLHVFS